MGKSHATGSKDREEYHQFVSELLQNTQATHTVLYKQAKAVVSVRDLKADRLSL